MLPILAQHGCIDIDVLCFSASHKLTRLWRPAIDLFCCAMVAY